MQADSAQNAASNEAGHAGDSQPQPYVITLNRNDVLLGRGRPVVRFEGNIRFRRLVQNRKAQYRATGRNVIKDSIARELIQTVKSRDGRFLRKVESPEEAIELGIPSGVQGWVIADDNAVLQKVKQAFRDEQRAEAGNETDAGLSPSNRSLPDFSERHASLEDQLGLQYPDAAQHMSMLRNREAASGLFSSFAPDPSRISLEQTLSMLRQSDLAAQQQHLQSLSTQLPAAPVTDSEFSQLRSFLLSRNEAAAHNSLPPYQQEQQQSLSSPARLSSQLRARALADLQQERLRQEQMQDAFADLQRHQGGLSAAASYAGASHSLSPSLDHFAAARHGAAQMFPGAAAYERELFLSQARAPVPHQSAQPSLPPTASLAEQIAALQSRVDSNFPYVPPSNDAHSFLQNTNALSDTANLPLDTDTLATSQGMRSGINRASGIEPTLRRDLLEAWLRSLSGADPESKPHDR
jgi:hypothetical protein